MPIKISIAMATYNGAVHVEEQLQSFAEQTLVPYELVVTDDGSTDGTLDIVEKFSRTAPFKIKVVRNNANMGYAQNFGKAIALCSGDIIFLSDQDDIWLPEKLEQVLDEFIIRQDVQVIINDTRIVNSDLRDTGLTKLGQVRSLGLRDREFLPGCCSAFRSEFRDILLPVPTSVFVHDTWLHALADILDVRWVIDAPLQLYRRHEGNASTALQSATRPLGRKDHFKAYSAGDSRVYTARQLEKIILLRGRLRAVQGKYNVVPESNFNLAQIRLEAWESAARARLDLLAHRRLARIAPALAMLVRGQYAHFSGWRSFGKDLTKP